MSRSVYENDDWDESRYALWENAVRRATYSKRGQAVLREMEEALLALPEHKLIDGMICDGTGVCAVGAIAAYRQVKSGKTWEEAFAALDESDEYDLEDEDDRGSIDDTARFARDKLKMAFSLAWDIAYNNDHWFGRKTPEERHASMLKWVRATLKEPVPA